MDEKRLRNALFWLVLISLLSAFFSVAFLLRGFVFASAGGDLRDHEKFFWVVSLAACPLSAAAAFYLFLKNYSDLGLSTKFLVPIGLIPAFLTILSGLALIWKSWL